MNLFRPAASIAFLSLCLSAFALGDGKVHIYFVDIGQGDSTLIIGPQGTSILIDGGPSDTVTPINEAVNDAIAAGLTDNTLDYVICSHFHQDHLEGLEEVAKAFPGGIIQAYDRGGARSIVAFTEYDNYFGASGLNKRKFAESFSIGTGATMTYIGHPTAGESDENNNGVIYRLDFGYFKCSLGGDLGDSYEVNYASAMGNVDHYKANHHGSQTSSQQSVVDVLLPQTHSFSFAIGNSYGHPHTAAVNRLSAAGSARFDTPNHHAPAGPYIKLETDGGATYTVNGTSYIVPGAPTGPNAPSGLTATAIGTSQVDLAWTDNSSNETNFVVSRSTSSSGPYSDLPALAANTTAFSDTGLAASTTYYYFVRATNAAGSSPNSNQASATTGTPPPPATLKINEAVPAPSSGSEWVEIYNSGATTVNLSGWQLDDLLGGGSAPVALSGSIAPGAFFVYTYSGSVLNNAGDDINLINPSASVVDSTTYGSAPSGSSWARSVDGSGAFAWDATPSSGASNNLVLSTFSSVSGDDGYVIESTENSNVGGSISSSATTIRIGDDSAKKQQRGVLSFDTSSIPDTATITKVTLKVTRNTVSSTPWSTLGTLTVDIKSPNFGAAATLATDDFASAAGASDVATVPQPGANNVTVSAQLSAAGLSNVSKTGKTQLKLRFTTDDDNDVTNDYLAIYSGNYATIPAYQPKLEIEYSN